MLSSPNLTSAHIDEDAAHLASLGIQDQHFKREMSLWANFALGFTYLSPVVGIYTLFNYAIGTAGPAMWWSLLAVGIGQLLVAMTQSEVVSQFPVAGGIYPWARRLWGLKYAWLTGWMYMWALVGTIAAVVYGSGPYICAIFGFSPSAGNVVISALILLGIATFINFMGTKWLSRAAVFGFAAELIGCIAVGGWLLATHRMHGFGAVFHSYGAGAGHSYISAWIAGSLIAMWMYYGFEACGDVAEEVPNPGKVIPKAQRRTIYVGGAAGMFIALALTLSVPNYAAAISGKDANPVESVLTNAFGALGMKVVLAVVLISYLSCTISLEAAASRLMFSYARDKMMIGSKLLVRFWEARHIPPYALALATIAPAIIVLISLISADAVVKLISFAAAGIYVGFQMVVAAAIRAKLRGWKPSGPWTMGRWGLLVNIVALTYGLAAICNMTWPRGSDWLSRWVTALGLLVVAGIGLMYMGLAKPYAHGDQPWDDARKNIDYSKLRKPESAAPIAVPVEAD